MKNSSKFELKIDRNLTRSRSGFEASSASSNTRALNSSQLSSRLRKLSGENDWWNTAYGSFRRLPPDMRSREAAEPSTAGRSFPPKVRQTSVARSTRRGREIHAGFGKLPTSCILAYNPYDAK